MIWKLEEYERDGERLGRIIEDDDVIVADVVGALDACGNYENAWLIAAAPELRSACISAYFALRDGSDVEIAMDTLRKAVQSCPFHVGTTGKEAIA